MVARKLHRKPSVLCTRFPNDLWTIRQARDLTQHEIASKIGISRGQYALFETGQQLPAIKILKKMLETLDVEESELYRMRNLKLTHEFS